MLQEPIKNVLEEKIYRKFIFSDRRAKKISADPAGSQAGRRARRGGQNG